MNQVAVQRNVFSVREEMMRAADTDRRERLVCPKPRRLGLINTTVNDNPFRHRFDSVAANDALDLLFLKVHNFAKLLKLKLIQQEDY